MCPPIEIPPEKNPIDIAGVEALRAKGYGDNAPFMIPQLFQTYKNVALFFDSCDPEVAAIARKDITDPEGFRLFIEKYL